MNREHPDTFWIPDRVVRDSLAPGQAVKLVFEIETENEDGHNELVGERMWVLVASRVLDQYLGILLNEPACVDPSSDFYLVRGTEIPFGPEHVIAVDNPPPGFAAAWLNSPPARRWPRDS